MQYCSIVVKGRDVVIAQLWQMSDTYREIFNCFLQVLILCDWVGLFVEAILNYVES